MTCFTSEAIGIEASDAYVGWRNGAARDIAAIERAEPSRCSLNLKCAHRRRLRSPLRGGVTRRLGQQAHPASVSGPLRTCRPLALMSAFKGEADMPSWAGRACLLVTQSGHCICFKHPVKPLRSDKLNRYNALWFDPGGRHEATGVHCAC